MIESMIESYQEPTIEDGFDFIINIEDLNKEYV